MMKRRLSLILCALLSLIAILACTPDKAMDFGHDGEITVPPADALSQKILHDFDGKDFQLGANDRDAEVRMANWPATYHVLIPFWLGVNPLFPYIMRPKLGRIYVISESLMVRPLQPDGHYLIRAGSKMFKADALFVATHTRYTRPGRMLPTIVRFVGTLMITVPKDKPAEGTVTERVAILREVSLPMRVVKQPPEYATYEVR